MQKNFAAKNGKMATLIKMELFMQTKNLQNIFLKKVVRAGERIRDLLILFIF
jgi:hypothetical protein